MTSNKIKVDSTVCISMHKNVVLETDDYDTIKEKDKDGFINDKIIVSDKALKEAADNNKSVDNLYKDWSIDELEVFRNDK